MQRPDRTADFQHVDQRMMAGGLDGDHVRTGFSHAAGESEAGQPLGREIGERRPEIVASEDEANRHRLVADLHGLSNSFGP